MTGSSAESTSTVDEASNPGSSRPFDSRTRSRMGALLLCLTLAVVLATGCGGSATGSTTTSTTTSTTSTASPSTSPSTEGGKWSAEEQAAVDGLLAARQAFSQSLEAPNSDDPALPATHVDPMLTEVRNTNAEWAGFGQAGRFPDNSVSETVPLTVDVNGDKATIETCGVDDSILYEPATGKVLNDDVVTVRATSTLVRTDGVWKLETRTEIERWEGIDGCAESHS